MKGHIRQRTKGSWTIVIDVGRDPETGKRRQQWHTVKGTKRDAERELRQLLGSIETGSYVKPSRITVGEWLEQWYESYVTVHTTPRTQESYRCIIFHHIAPNMGLIPLAHLQPQHLQGYYARKLARGRVDGKGGLSARTVLYHHRIISEVLGHAVKMGLLARNVAKLVDPPRPARMKMSFLAPTDIPRFLGAARGTPYYVLFSLLLYTGLRRGEALALTWRNVDLIGAELQVLQTAFKLGDGTYVLKEPKTAHSRRSVSLPPSLAVLLRQYREDRQKLQASLGKPLTDDDFVVSHPDGRPLNPNAVTRAFISLVRQAELPHIRLHDLRHTHATLMLKAGVHPKVVSERLGHANIAITLDTYSHVLPGLQQAAAERFDGLLEESIMETEKRGDVSKMLARDAELASEPCGIRTHDTLIKSNVV